MSYGAFLAGTLKGLSDYTVNERDQQRKKEDEYLQGQKDYLDHLFAGVQSGDVDPRVYGQALQDSHTAAEALVNPGPRKKGSAGFFGAHELPTLPFYNALTSGQVQLPKRGGAASAPPTIGGMPAPTGGASPAGAPSGGGGAPQGPATLVPPPGLGDGPIAPLGAPTAPQTPTGPADPTAQFIPSLKTLDPSAVPAGPSPTAAGYRPNPVSPTLPASPSLAPPPGMEHVATSDLFITPAQKALVAAHVATQAAIEKAKTNAAYLGSPDYKALSPVQQLAVQRELTGYTPPTPQRLIKGPITPDPENPGKFVQQMLHPLTGEVVNTIDAPAPSVTLGTAQVRNDLTLAQTLVDTHQATDLPTALNRVRLTRLNQMAANLTGKELSNTQAKSIDALKTQNEALKWANGVLGADPSVSAQQRVDLANSALQSSGGSGINIGKLDNTDLATIYPKFKALDTNAQQALRGITIVQARIPQVLQALHEASADPSNDPIPQKIDKALYKLGVSPGQGEEWLLQNVGAIEANALRGLIPGRPNQSLQDIVHFHLPQPGDSPELLIQKMENLQNILGDTQRAITTAGATGVGGVRVSGGGTTPSALPPPPGMATPAAVIPPAIAKQLADLKAGHVRAIGGIEYARLPSGELRQLPVKK